MNVLIPFSISHHSQPPKSHWVTLPPNRDHFEAPRFRIKFMVVHICCSLSYHLIIVLIRFTHALNYRQGFSDLPTPFTRSGSGMVLGCLLFITRYLQ